MDETDKMLVLGFLFMMAGSIQGEECNSDEFAVCIRDVNGLQGGDFNFVNEDQIKEVCNAKMETIQCASDFIQNCMKPGEKSIYEATTGGKLKVVQEMCTDGSKINKGFLQHMNCFGRLQDEINFCNDKFKESQTLLTKANMIEKLKMFYGCCAFEWYRNCLAKTARMKCNDEASAFMYYVTTVLGGEVQNAICKSSYSSCHGLHGVDEEEIDEKFENISQSEEEYVPNSSAYFACAISQTITILIVLTCFSMIHRENCIL